MLTADSPLLAHKGRRRDLIQSWPGPAVSGLSIDLPAQRIPLCQLAGDAGVNHK